MEIKNSLPGSVSHFNNNLTCSDKRFAYVSNTKPQVYVLNLSNINDSTIKSASIGKYRREEPILFISYERLSSYVLVIGLSKVLQVWNDDCSRLLFELNSQAIDGTEESFFVGSCSTSDHLIVGSTEGLVFIRHSLSGKNFTFTIDSVSRWSIPILALDCNIGLVVSADEAGGILIWNIQGNMLKTIEGDESPATGVKIVQKFAYVALATGFLKVLDLDSLLVVYNIASHARWITGICKHASEPAVYTCGEDGAINGWKANDQGEIEAAGSMRVDNELLTGIISVNNDIYVVAYDKSNLYKVRF